MKSGDSLSSVSYTVRSIFTNFTLTQESPECLIYPFSLALTTT